MIFLPRNSLSVATPSYKPKQPIKTISVFEFAEEEAALVRFHNFNYVSAPWIVLPALCYLVCFVEICFVFFQETVTNITIRKIRLIGIRVLFRKAFIYLYRGKIIFFGFFKIVLICIEFTRIVITRRKSRLIGIGVLFHKALIYLYRGEIIFLCFVRLILVIIETAHIVITPRKSRFIDIGVVFYKSLIYLYRVEIVFFCFFGLTLLVI